MHRSPKALLAIFSIVMMLGGIVGLAQNNPATPNSGSGVPQTTVPNTAPSQPPAAPLPDTTPSTAAQPAVEQPKSAEQPQNQPLRPTRQSQTPGKSQLSKRRLTRNRLTKRQATSRRRALATPARLSQPLRQLQSRRRSPKPTFLIAPPLPARWSQTGTIPFLIPRPCRAPQPRWSEAPSPASIACATA